MRSSLLPPPPLPAAAAAAATNAASCSGCFPAAVGQLSCGLSVPFLQINKCGSSPLHVNIALQTARPRPSPPIHFAFTNSQQAAAQPPGSTRHYWPPTSPEARPPQNATSLAGGLGLWLAKGSHCSSLLRRLVRTRAWTVYAGGLVERMSLSRMTMAVISSR